MVGMANPGAAGGVRRLRTLPGDPCIAKDCDLHLFLSPELQSAVAVPSRCRSVTEPQEESRPGEKIVCNASLGVKWFLATVTCRTSVGHITPVLQKCNLYYEENFELSNYFLYTSGTVHNGSSANIFNKNK